jgi:hypothetical protein
MYYKQLNAGMAQKKMRDAQDGAENRESRIEDSE